MTNFQPTKNTWNKYYFWHFLWNHKIGKTNKKCEKEWLNEIKNAHKNKHLKL